MRQWMVAAAALVLLAGSPAWAQNDWTGNTLTGTLNFGGDTTNYFDPTNGLVPSGTSGIQPLAIVSSDDDDFTEFEAFDDVSTFRWNVDVDSSTVQVSQFTQTSSLGTSDWDIYLSGFNPGLTGVAPASSTFPELFWLVEDDGSTLHLTYPGGNILPLEGWTAQLELSGEGGAEPGVVIPAPGAIVLGSLGVGLIGWLRKRRAL